jgi:hypothetical protein
MSGRRGYIERDPRGRGRIVLPRSGSYHRTRSQSYDGDRRTTRELLDEAEEREAILTAEVASLQTRLSFAQRAEWQLQNLQRDHQTLRTEHGHCRNMRVQLEAQEREVGRVGDLLAEVQEKYEELKERYRLMKRGSASGEGYKIRFEEKAMEVDLLRHRISEREEALRLMEVRLVDKSNALRLAETRLVDRDSTIRYLKDYLRTHGFRVGD